MAGIISKFFTRDVSYLILYTKNSYRVPQTSVTSNFLISSKWFKKEKVYFVLIHFSFSVENNTISPSFLLSFDKLFQHTIFFQCRSLISIFSIRFNFKLRLINLDMAIRNAKTYQRCHSVEKHSKIIKKFHNFDNEIPCLFNTMTKQYFGH